MIRRSPLLIVPLSFLAWTAAARTDEPTADQRLEVLKEEIAALRVDMAKTQSARSVTSPFPGVTLSGFAQVDLAFRESSENQLDPANAPLNENRFDLRRARLRLQGDFGMVGSVLEADFNTVNGAQARVVDAELTIGWPPDQPGGPRLVAATLGLFKIPFGFEVVQSDRDRLFLERSTVVRALFPGEYDLGARVAGAWWFLRYAVAVQNGNPLGDRQFPGRDPNDAKDVTGRVGVDGDLGPVRVTGGVSAEVGKGFHSGTAATKDTVVWRDINSDGSVQPTEIQVIRGTASTPSVDFDRYAVGADLSVSFDPFGFGPLTIYGEIIVAQNLDRGLQVADPIASNRDMRELGWYVAATQRIGPFQLGVRYDRYDPDADRNDTLAGAVVPGDATYSSLAIALALILTNARIIVEGDINRNHLGLDDTGAPGNLDDDAITLRGEMRF